MVHEHNTKTSSGSRRASDDEHVTYKSSSKRRHSEFQVSPDALEIQRLQKLYSMFRKKASGDGDLMSPQRQQQLDVWLRELESRQRRAQSPYRHHHTSSKMADFLASPQALSLRREASAKRKAHTRKHRANSHQGSEQLMRITKEPQLNLPTSQRIQRAYSHMVAIQHPEMIIKVIHT